MAKTPGLPDVSGVPVPVLVRIPALGLTVAGYTDGFGFYLADEELLGAAAPGGGSAADRWLADRDSRDPLSGVGGRSR